MYSLSFSWILLRHHTSSSFLTFFLHSLFALVSEELSYVQRKIESFVDQIRAGEELKAQQSSELRKAEESRDNLQAKLSKASEERRFFRMELDGERETAKSSLADLKSKLETVVRDLFDHSLSQLQGVRNDLLQNKEENQMLSVRSSVPTLERCVDIRASVTIRL